MRGLSVCLVSIELKILVVPACHAWACQVLMRAGLASLWWTLALSTDLTSLPVLESFETGFSRRFGKDGSTALKDEAACPLHSPEPPHA